MLDVENELLLNLCTYSKLIIRLRFSKTKNLSAQTLTIISQVSFLANGFFYQLSKQTNN